MHAVQSYQKKEAPQYVQALLQCPERKTCTNLANTLNKKHDAIYRDFSKAITNDEDATAPLKNIAQSELNQEEIHLIHDDTQLTKLYAKKIEGLDVGFDGSLGKPALGLKVITSLLTDRRVSVPIEAVPYITKELAQAGYKTKSEIAIDVTRHVIKHFKIKRMLADAHFATIPMITFLNDEQLNYLMKIPRSRVVTIGGDTGQLKNILRLKKNNRMKAAAGSFNGIDCWFYVVKVSNGTTIYLISNDQIDPYEVVELYRIRWSIELFHRTSKQYLGLKDCQMRSIEKQRQHMLYVMHAYAIASVRRALTEVSSVEDIINHVRHVKSRYSATRKHSVERNFSHVA